MINIKDLTEKDINRKVAYTSHVGANPEEGRITSYNESWIFVDYTNTGRGIATPSDKLHFVNIRI